MVNGAGTAPTALMRRTRSSLISVQCVILGRASARGNSFCARSTAVSTISMATSPLAWQLTWMPARCTRSIQAFRSSCVSVRLPLYGGVTPGYGVLSAMVRSENDPSTVCSEVAPSRIHSSPKPRLDAARDHRLQHLAAGLVAHAVQQISARPHLLQREQIAAFVMHAGHAIADELLRDVGQPVAVALQPLLLGKGRPLADLAERIPSPGR